METIAYQLTTCSGLIVSPRSALAFYRDLDEFSLEKVEDSEYLAKSRLKVIYPFYQYGIYTAYNPEGAAYYLPGSSVKGALCRGTSVEGGLMSDDILIPGSYIVLRNIYKVQYLEENTQACFAPFFDNVGVEMVRADSPLQGQLILPDRNSANALITAANKSAKIKIGQMLEYLSELAKREYKEEMTKKLHTIIENLSPYLENDHIILLGGYKGLLHSMEIKDPSAVTNSGVFIDPEKDLPYGLAEIEFI